MCGAKGDRGRQGNATKLFELALRFALGAAVAVWLTTDLYAAQPAAADEQTITEELKAVEDPTILKRRAWLETEWNTFKDDSHNIEEILGGLWAWRVSSNQDWAVRLKLPLEWHVAGDAAGDSDKAGFGDIKLATGTAFRLGESWRAGGGLELRAPSGTEHDLSDNVWRLQEFGAVAWDATKHLVLSPSFEYNESLAEEPGAPPQHFLEMFFPATCLLPRHWSATARYEAKVDFETDNTWTHSAKFAVAKNLERAPVSFVLSIKKPFDGGAKDFQVNFIATWYFRSRNRSLPETE